MFVVMPKWTVTVRFPDREMVLRVSNPFIANVLRTVADLEFGQTALEQPVSITIAIEHVA